MAKFCEFLILTSCLGLAFLALLHLTDVAQEDSDPYWWSNLQKGDIVASRRNRRELRNFRELMLQWPKNKPKALIYFLVEFERLDQLKMAIGSLEEYFNDKFQYPIVIFHEDLTHKTLKNIRNYTKSQVFFQEVKLNLPTDHVIEYLVPEKDCVDRPVTYRHMCRFNAYQVYKQPIFDYVDYYWRLDTDSRILRPIAYDVFQRLRLEKKLHGYIWRKLDGAACVAGLWEASRRYCDKNDIVPYFFDKWPDRQVYYNNFEISTLNFWRSEPVQKYLRHIDDLGGIYYLRWGDNPIHGIAVSIFMRENQTLYFDDIGYAHDKVIVRY